MKNEKEKKIQSQNCRKRVNRYPLIHKYMTAQLPCLVPVKKNRS